VKKSSFLDFQKNRVKFILHFPKNRVKFILHLANLEKKNFLEKPLQRYEKMSLLGIEIA
jgi:hypothetical protein